MTIEERAKDAYMGVSYYNGDFARCAYDMYEKGATEQKAIDDAYYAKALEEALLEKEAIYKDLKRKMLVKACQFISLCLLVYSLIMMLIR